MPTDTALPCISSQSRGLILAGGSAIALVFGALGAWAAMAPLDSAAIATAEVAVSSTRKPIQHLEGGIIRKVLVSEAQWVEAGQILVVLDPAQAQSNLDPMRASLDGTLAQIARLEAELGQREEITWPDILLARRAEPRVAAAMATQEQRFAESKRALESQIGVYASRIRGTAIDLLGKQRRAAAAAQQIASLESDIERLSPVVERGFYARNRLNDQWRTVWRMQGDLGALEADIAKAQSEDEEAQTQIAALVHNHLQSAANDLTEAAAKQVEFENKLQLARDVLTRIEIRAPRAGIVQGLRFSTAGEVVKPGDTLAELVTPDEGLMMNAHVTPDDRDIVRAGAPVQIRFPAYASRQRAAVSGWVETIASDLTVDPGGRQPSTYLARVAIDAGTLPPELNGKLVPGMPASVLINTGERTLLAYLAGPAYERIVGTMRQR